MVSLIVHMHMHLLYHTDMQVTARTPGTMKEVPQLAPAGVPR